MTRTLTTEQLRAEMIEKIAVASGLRARDGRNVVAKAIYIDVVQPLLATNREAQPVGVMNIGSETCSDYRVAWTKSGTQLGKGVHWLYTTPPAPAVPDAVDYSDLDATSQDREVIEAIAECKGWNACRAAMLAQPVSCGYTLVPIVPTQEMRDAWFFMEDFDTEWKAMLAAATGES